MYLYVNIENGRDAVLTSYTTAILSHTSECLGVDTKCGFPKNWFGESPQQPTSLPQINKIKVQIKHLIVSYQFSCCTKRLPVDTDPHLPETFNVPCLPHCVKDCDSLNWKFLTTGMALFYKYTRGACDSANLNQQHSRSGHTHSHTLWTPVGVLGKGHYSKAL